MSITQNAMRCWSIQFADCLSFESGVYRQTRLIFVSLDQACFW